MDARDIVKKYGYLVKVANTRPHIVLKYIMSKCKILTEYELIAAGLPDAAVVFSNAKEDEVELTKVDLVLEIEDCHETLQEP